MKLWQCKLSSPYFFFLALLAIMCTDWGFYHLVPPSVRLRMWMVLPAKLKSWLGSSSPKESARVEFSSATVSSLPNQSSSGMHRKVWYNLLNYIVKERTAVGVGDGSQEKHIPIENSLNHRFFKPSYQRTLIALLLYSYQQITIATLQYLSCVDVNGQDVVFSSPSISCSSSEYRQWMAVVILLLVFDVCLFPLGLGFVLFRKREQIWSKDRLLIQQIGILYEAYSPRAYLWQPVVLIRQVVLVGLSLAFQADYYARYLSYTYFNFILFTLHVLVRPYELFSDNLMEGVSLGLLVLMSSFLDAQVSHNGQLDTGAQLYVSFLFFPALLLFIIWMLLTRYCISKSVIDPRKTQDAWQANKSDGSASQRAPSSSSSPSVVVMAATKAGSGRKVVPSNNNNRYGSGHIDLDLTASAVLTVQPKSPQRDAEKEDLTIRAQPRVQRNR